MSAAATAAVPTLTPAVKKFVDDSNSAITALTTAANNGIKAGKITAAEATQFKQLVDTLKAKINTAATDGKVTLPETQTIANDIAAAKLTLAKILEAPAAPVAKPAVPAAPAAPVAKPVVPAAPAAALSLQETNAIRQVVLDYNRNIKALATTYSGGVKADRATAGELVPISKLIDTLTAKVNATPYSDKLTLAAAQAIAKEIDAATEKLAQVLATADAKVAAQFAKIAAIEAAKPKMDPVTEKCMSDNEIAFRAFASQCGASDELQRNNAQAPAKLKKLFDDTFNMLRENRIIASENPTSKDLLGKCQAFSTKLAAQTVERDKLLFIYKPPAPRVCTAGMVGADICDVEVSANKWCQRARNESDYKICMAEDIASTPRNCTLCTEAEKPGCNAYNKAKFPNYTPPAPPAPVVAKPFTAPPSIGNRMSDPALGDIYDRAYASCKSSKSENEFGACVQTFIARTPRNCALAEPANKPDCDTYNRKTFGIR